MEVQRIRKNTSSRSNVRYQGRVGGATKQVSPREAVAWFGVNQVVPSEYPYVVCICDVLSMHLLFWDARFCRFGRVCLFRSSSVASHALPVLLHRGVWPETTTAAGVHMQ